MRTRSEFPLFTAKKGYNSLTLLVKGARCGLSEIRKLETIKRIYKYRDQSNIALYINSVIFLSWS